MVERVEEHKLPPPGTRLTMEEYEALPETNQIVELINGVLIVNPPPLLKHQLVSGRLYSRLQPIIPNGVLLYAPVGVRLAKGIIPEPDLVWVAEGSQCVVGEKYLEGPPDLVVEIFSPGSERYDRRDKFNLYQRFGVREYWMVDPDAQYIEVYRYENGAFVRQGVYGPDETFESAALGKPVDLKGIFD
ncbi:MAG: Uma2 family endonuclease [Chloroflexi bacterium]|nr:Uma2 family endonuclease [Chloroflexota bacterium]